MRRKFSKWTSAAGFIIAISLESGCWSASIRSEQQIVADLQASPIPNYPFADQIDPRFRQQMTRELVGPLKHAVPLYLELENASPRYLDHSREKICLDEAELSLLGDHDALQALTDQSQSKVVSDAVLGQIGLLVYSWWNQTDEANQKKVLSQFEALAKAHPTDNLMCGSLLTVARYGVSSDDIASSARDIVDKYLTGPDALKYKASPNKLGRPFVLQGNSIDRKTVSTAALKGKVVIVDFWATWCGPCRAALPELIQLYKTDHDKGLEVIGVSNDSNLNDLHGFLAGNKDMVWPQLFDPAGPNGWNRLAGQMDVDAIPTQFFIDRNGILRDIEVNDLRKDFVEKLLAEQVKTPPTVAAAPPTNTPPPPPVSAPPIAPPPTVDTPSVSIAQSIKSANPDGDNANQSPDDLANSILSKAKLLIDNNRTDLAADKLNGLIAKYPNTAAADKAKELLSTLNSH